MKDDTTSALNSKGDEITFSFINADEHQEHPEDDFLSARPHHEFDAEPPTEHPPLASSEPPGHQAVDGNNGENTSEQFTGKQNSNASSKARAPFASPMKDLRPKIDGKWYNHKTKSTHTNEEIIDNVITFVFNEAETKHCIDSRGRATKCSCLHDILKLTNSTEILSNCAYSLFHDYFKVTDGDEKHHYLLREIRHADAYEALLGRVGKVSRRPKKFLLPCRVIPRTREDSIKNDNIQTVDETTTTTTTTTETTLRNIATNSYNDSSRKRRKMEVGPFICICAFCRLHTIGSTRFAYYFGKGCTDEAPHNISKNNYHGNNNRGKRFEEAYSSIKLFLESLKNEKAELMTTPLKTVKPKPLKKRQKTKHDVTTSIKNNQYNSEADSQYLLPPHMTQRDLYEQWVWSRGWSTRNKGTSSMTSDRRNYDNDHCDQVLPIGSKPQEIVSIVCFKKYWSEKFPNLCVRDHYATKMDNSK
ncbi:hypothetical protein ACHAXS_002100 [Conticribra weissflogii]